MPKVTEILPKSCCNILRLQSSQLQALTQSSTKRAAKAMRLPHGALVCLLLATVVLGADPACRSGKRHPDGKACCAASCGDQCGATKCAAGGQGSKCCGSTIITTAKSCNISNAPCNIEPVLAAVAPVAQISCPRNSIANGNVCCKSGCTKCGGTGCAQLSGGYNNCCMGAITSANKACSVTKASPCVLNAASKGAPAPTSIKRPFKVGIFEGALFTSGPLSVTEREKAYGFHYDHLLRFQSVYALDHKELKAILDGGHNVILNMEFMTDYADNTLHPTRHMCTTTACVKDIHLGVFDKYLIPFAKSLKADGRQITIRTLHEQNGNWYPWGLLYKKDGATNSIGDYNLAWRHILDLFKTYKAPVIWQLGVCALTFAITFLYAMHMRVRFMQTHGGAHQDI
eukprot:16619-Heterococcus_DN1.PRE.5